MADEEVDWGVDDSVDVWRGSGDVDMGVDEDEDVFDLDGMDAEPEGGYEYGILQHPQPPTATHTPLSRFGGDRRN
jgi:hypothetical protein